ncbi:MAG: GAF domain-containing protein, partial [Nakamurella sp.]
MPISPEARRSQSAQHYLVDGPLSARLETLLRLASQSIDFPVIMVNILDQDTQHTVSLIGADDRTIRPRSDAFCDTVVRTGLPVLVDDAATDLRFARFPAVLDGTVGSYLGVPLIGREAAIIGAVCVIDGQARTIDQGQVRRLTE